MGKERTKGFISGFICAVFVVSLIGAAAASVVKKQLEASYSDIKITIDGEDFTPKNASGNTVEPFIIDGTTYLPVRAIADAAGYDVDWDGNTNTVSLDSDVSTNSDYSTAYMMLSNYSSAVDEATLLLDETVYIKMLQENSSTITASWLLNAFNANYDLDSKTMTDMSTKANELLSNYKSDSNFKYLIDTLSVLDTYQSLCDDYATALRAYISSGDYTTFSNYNTEMKLLRTTALPLRNQIYEKYISTTEK